MTQEPLTGRQIGVFAIKELVGVGGMGEVYRALDTRLGRDVAIKILPHAFKNDSDRIARFQREARVLASLNHPNIASIFGLEEADDITALVMEFVSGDSLSRRRLGVEDALSIGRQVAQALEAAHEQGVVHRDLKPANIKVRPDGTVKVLDFGLATALRSQQGSEPTLTLQTQPGAILGTPAYMSPEQARGEAVGQDADIWAFGVLLYELLTGVAPFARPSTAGTLASVLGEQPDYTRLPEDTPPNIRNLIRRCLVKDRRRRLQHIGDARIELEEGSSESPGVQPPSPAPRRWSASFVVATGLGVALIASLASLWWSRTRPAPAAAEPVHLTTMLPLEASVTRAPLGPSLAISPDGRTLVIAGTDKAGQRLYRRRLDRLETSPIAGTDRASGPFFSWDGQWIGFFADGRLKRVPAGGGAAVEIVAIPGAYRRATWGPDGRIILSYGADGRMHTVDASGGPAEALADVKGYYPDLAADGQTLLFELGGWVHALDRTTGRQQRLVQGTSPRYALGRLFLTRGNTLLAAPVDLARQTMTGSVVPVLEGVASDAGPGGGTRHYAISNAGTLAYVPAAGAYSLVFLKADGAEQILGEAQRSFLNPQFSPDGKLVAVAQVRPEGGPADVWVYDPAGRTATRLTFDGARAPIWAPDGTLTYAHTTGEKRGIYSKPVDGRSQARQLVALDAFHWLVGWSQDQQTLAYGLMEGSESSILSHRDGQSRRIVGPSAIWGGRLSHDGRLLVYYSLDSGNFEVYVTPFPAAGTRWLIGEGTDPAWAPDGKTVYYRSGARLMAASVDTTAGVRVLSQRVVIEPFLPPGYDDYAIHPDGRTLVFVRPAGGTYVREVNVIVNWHEELARGPAGK